MPNSLRAKISSLRYKGKITEEEYKDLISKLDGHDKALRSPWIPCSERMPKPCVEVLATTTWGDVTMAIYFPDDTWTIHEGNTNATNEDILAWMPKPERYKKEGERMYFVIHTEDKATKARVGKHVVYNVDWLKKHFDIERKLYEKPGKWIWNKCTGEYECSECGRIPAYDRTTPDNSEIDKYRYCRWCGAPMGVLNGKNDI